MDAERADHQGGAGDAVTPSAPGGARRPTLNDAVRRRRADRAFYLRLADIMRHNERALERLAR